MNHFHGVDILGAEGGYTDSTTVKAVQEKLMEISNALPASDARKSQFNPGPIDGVYGPKTASAVRALQTQNGVPATGLIDEWVLRMFNISAPGGLLDAVTDIFKSKTSVPTATKFPAAHVPVTPPSTSRPTTTLAPQQTQNSLSNVMPASVAGVPTWQAALVAAGAVAVGLGMYLKFKPTQRAAH